MYALGKYSLCNLELLSFFTGEPMDETIIDISEDDSTDLLN